MNRLLAISLCLISHYCYGQFGQGNEVILVNGKCGLEPYQNKLKPDFSLDARRTLFKKEWIAVMGLKFGVEYRRIHRMGIGVYFLNSRVFDEDFEFDLEVGKVEYEFRYSTLYYERVIYFDRKWEFGATTHFGGGQIRAFFQNPENPNDRIELDPLQFSTIELSIYGDYNILYWLGAGVGTGYRSVFGVNSDLKKEFSSPIFVVTLQMKLFKLARSFYDESVKNEF